MEDYQKHGVPIMDKDLEQIDKLFQSKNIIIIFGEGNHATKSSITITSIFEQTA